MADSQQLLRLRPEAAELLVVRLYLLHPLHGLGKPVAGLIFLAELPVNHGEEEAFGGIGGIIVRAEADGFFQVGDGPLPVVGTVTGLAKAGPPVSFEHDADWWVATIDVHHVEHGDVPQGSVNVAYANSLDVRWRGSPKPKAGQSGVWMLHRSVGPVAEFAPFYLPHPDDFQPTQVLDAIRSAGGGS